MIQCRWSLTVEATDVTSPLDDSDLETEADTQEGDLLLTGPLDSRNHALRTADTETTWHDDTP